MLDDERRVLSQRSIVGAIGAAKSNVLGRQIARLPAKYAALSASPAIEFTPLHGGIAVKGREASWFVDLLKAYDEASDEGTLHPTQERMAKASRVILRALAGVGLAALVDEVTAYQNVRASDSLRRLLARLVTPDALPWERMWPQPVVASLCRTIGIEYDGRTFPAPMLGTVGTIYGIILGTEVHAEVKRLNPRRPDRKMHHQHFQPELRKLAASDLAIVKALADQSANKHEFWMRLRAHYQGAPLQLSFGAAH